MKLQSGTYIREPDGACHLYYSPVSWNDPIVGLKQFQKDGHMASYPEIDRWNRVTDEEEIAELKQWLGGNLWAGEYAEIKAHELVELNDASSSDRSE